MLHLGDNIRYIRLLCGLTQTEFGEKIGVTKDKLYTYEKGKASPNEVVLSKIAKIAKINRKTNRNEN